MSNNTVLVAGMLVLIWSPLCHGEAGARAEQPEPAVLSGTVKNAPRGTRVVARRRGALDRAPDVPVSAETGGYQIRGLPPGQYDLTVVLPDGRAWCGLDPAPSRRAVSPDIRREIESLLSRYEGWLNLQHGAADVFSRSYVDAGGRDYAEIVRHRTNAMRVIEARRTQQTKRTGDDTYEWVVKIERVTPEEEEGTVSVFAGIAQVRTVIATGESQTAPGAWGLYEAGEEDGTWRLLGEALVVGRWHNVKKVLAVPSPKLAGITLKSGERSEGHDLELPEAVAR